MDRVRWEGVWELSMSGKLWLGCDAEDLGALVDRPGFPAFPYRNVPRVHKLKLSRPS